MPIKNQDLIDKLASHFKIEMDNNSTRTVILFPMSFTIILHETDYNRLSAWFQDIITSIVEQLYNEIKKKAKGSMEKRIINKILRHRNSFRITPPSNEWSFEIVNSDVSEINGIAINEGNPVFLSSPCPLKIAKGGNVDVNPNINVSLSCNNSDPNKNYNVNLESIRGVNVLGGNQCRYKYNRSLSLDDTDSILSMDDGKYAHIYGNIYYKSLVFSIRDILVSISGNKDERTNNNIFKLDTPDLESDHVQIKYQKNENRFYVSTVAPDTRLNQRPLPQSIGGNIKWTLLPNNSEILMKGLYSVHFSSDQLITLHDLYT